MFETSKIHVFFRGSDMMIALPASKAHGDDEQVKETLAIIFSLEVGDMRANHKYSQLPEGWKCYRVANGQLPKQIRDPGTKKYVPWDKIVVVKDAPKQREMKVAKGERKPAPQAETVRYESDASEMVAVPANSLNALIAQNQEMLKSMQEMIRLYELTIQNIGLSMLRK